MTKTCVKVCGITEPNMAKEAALAGATFIGLVFHPDSKRHIEDLTLAKQIVKGTHAHGARAVGVFVNQTADDINAICEQTGINLVQLHGDIARKGIASINKTINKIYVIPVNAQGNYQLQADQLNLLDSSSDYLLFDYKTPGTGTKFDHNNFSYAGNFDYFIAGGLCPNNVADCIDLLNPFAVDVSSGVEDKSGSKSIALIHQFIQEAHHAS